MSQNLDKQFSGISTESPETQRPQHPSAPGTSCFCHLIGITLLLAVMLCLLIPLVYLFGDEQTHENSYHPLSKVFRHSTFSEVSKKLNKKSNKYINLCGSWDEGLEHFIEFYADKRSQKGKSVIMRKYAEEKPFKVALEMVRSTKIIVEDYLDIQQNQNGTVTWILIIKESNLPENQIQFLQKNRPNDRIITVMNKTNIREDLVDISCPSVNEAELRNLLQKKHQLTGQQVDILFNFYNSSGNVLQKFSMHKFDLKDFFESNYFDLQTFNSEEKKILKRLCLDGVSSHAGIKFEDYHGFAVRNRSVYWRNKETRLCYQMQAEISCKDMIAPEQTLDQIKQQNPSEVRGKKKKKSAGIKGKKKSTQ